MFFGTETPRLRGFVLKSGQFHPEVRTFLLFDETRTAPHRVWIGTARRRNQFGSSTFKTPTLFLIYYAPSLYVRDQAAFQRCCPYYIRTNRSNSAGTSQFHARISVVSTELCVHRSYTAPLSEQPTVGPREYLGVSLKAAKTLCLNVDV